MDTIYNAILFTDTPTMPSTTMPIRQPCFVFVLKHFSLKKVFFAIKDQPKLKLLTLSIVQDVLGQLPELAV